MFRKETGVKAVIPGRKGKPTFEGAVDRVRDDEDARFAVILAGVGAFSLGFVLGFVLGEREGSGGG